MRLTDGIRKAVAGVSRRTRERGVWHACRWVGHHVHERAQERRLGIETAEFNSWQDSVERANCHSYEPLAYWCIERAMDQVFTDVREGVFLDYGSGKGRAVIVAALRPFQRVIGVELVPELCEVACRNVERAQKHLRCTDVEVHCADATVFAVPDDVNCIYLYNPFWEEVLAAVQQRIRESLERRPRTLKIAYLLNDDQCDDFAQCSWLRETAARRELWERVHLVAYEFARPAEMTDKLAPQGASCA